MSYYHDYHTKICFECIIGIVHFLEMYDDMLWVEPDFVFKITNRPPDGTAAEFLSETCKRGLYGAYVPGYLYDRPTILSTS